MQKPNSSSSQRISIHLFLSTTVSLMNSRGSINIWKMNEEMNEVNEFIKYYNGESLLFNSSK